MPTLETDTPFAKQGQEILSLLRKKSPEDAIQPILDSIHTQATALSLPDPLVPSTDAYVTSICYIGSKSLSHVLSCIERCKERLLTIGAQSAEARKQIIESVMSYWKDQPGVGVNIVDKLLNYTILSPASVVEWALASNGRRLGDAFVYELVSATIGKVTGRVRQVVKASNAPSLTAEQRAVMRESAEREKKGMKDLFAVMEDFLVSWAGGSKDQMQEEMSDADGRMVQQWGERWLRVFRRKGAVEVAWAVEQGKVVVVDAVPGDGLNGNGSANGDVQGEDAMIE